MLFIVFLGARRSPYTPTPRAEQSQPSKKPMLRWVDFVSFSKAIRTEVP
jgi:hypothetical protein